MNREDFSAWRNHPITEQVFKYLKEDAAELAKNLATTNFGNQPSDLVAREQAQTYGVCKTVEEVTDINLYESISNFYKPEEEDEEIQQTGNTPD